MISQNSQSPSFNKQSVLTSEADAVEYVRRFRRYQNGVNGFIAFVFECCRTLDFDDFAIAQGRRPKQPSYNPPPNKAYVRDICRLVYYAPIDKVLVIGKSRQMTVSWILQCYVVYCMLFRLNQRIAWTSIRLDTAHAALKRVLKILENLNFPTPKYDPTKSEIIIPDYGNLFKVFPRGETQLTSEAWVVWIADEFSKIEPVALQDEIWREA